MLGMLAASLSHASEDEIAIWPRSPLNGRHGHADVQRGSDGAGGKQEQSAGDIVVEIRLRRAGAGEILVDQLLPITRRDPGHVRHAGRAQEIGRMAVNRLRTRARAKL